MTRGTLTCALLLMLIAYHKVEMAPSVSISSSVGVLGNNPHYVRCNYTLGSGSEPVISLQIIQNETPLAVLNAGVGIVLWEPTAPNDAKTRAVLSQPNGSTSLQINYTNTLCSDEKKYRCDVRYAVNSSTVVQSSDTIQLVIEASPGAQTMTPLAYNVTEYNTVTFTCTGNVGKPPGQIEWYLYKGSGFENKTSLASQQVNTVTPSSCTYTGKSTIKINVTRQEQGAFMQCRVYHPTQGSSSPLDTCTDASYCRRGNNITVYYPVSVSVLSTAVGSVYQGSSVTLTCSAEGYTVPRSEWYRMSDMTSSVGPSNLVRLSNLSLNDTDTYVCMGFNYDPNGRMLNDSKMVNISVVTTKTPLLTTALTKTTTTPLLTATSAKTTGTGGITCQQQDNGACTSSDVGAIVGGVVAAVVVLAVISVIVAVLIIKRKLKESLYAKPSTGRSEPPHIYLDLKTTGTGHGSGNSLNAWTPAGSDDTASTYEIIR